MNNDSISREALKKAIDDYAEKRQDILLWQADIEEIIDLAPNVEAFTKEDMAGAYNEGYACGSRENTRPQGEWIEHYSKEMSEKGYFLCSRCKCGFQRFERGIRHSDLPWIDGQKYELHCIDNFCPNCGADMRKGGADND